MNYGYIISDKKKEKKMKDKMKEMNEMNECGAAFVMRQLMNKIEKMMVLRTVTAEAISALFDEVDEIAFDAHEGYEYVLSHVQWLSESDEAAACHLCLQLFREMTAEQYIDDNLFFRVCAHLEELADATGISDEIADEVLYAQIRYA